MNASEFTLQAAGAELAGALYAPSGRARRVPLVFCHGIPSGLPPDPGDGGYPALAAWFCERGHPCAVFNFRGTGCSGGSFSLPGWRDDLLGLIDHLGTRAGWEAGLVLVGFSGGAAAALLAAAERSQVKGVAAFAAPADFEFLIGQARPRLLWEHFVSLGIVDPRLHPDDAAWVAEFRELSIERALPLISGRPLLFVHGERDNLVPPLHARRLYAGASGPKRLELLAQAGHRLRHEPLAIDGLARWLELSFDREQRS